MSDFTPTTDEVRDSLVYLNKYHAKHHGDVDLLVVGSETAAQFDRMIAEVERAAAEKAWDEGEQAGYEDALGEQRGIGPQESARNPYRRNEGEAS